MWYIHTIEHYLAIKKNQVEYLIDATQMNFKSIIPSEKSHAKEYTLYDYIYTRYSEEANLQTESRLVVDQAGLGREMIVYRQEISFGGEENVCPTTGLW